jgi:hypothetical protein
MAAAILSLFALIAAAVMPVSAAEIMFSKDIAPILLERCSSCHNTRTAKGDYDISTYELATQAVEEGDPDNSMLIYVIMHEDSQKRMPKDKDRLPAEELELIRQWISDGAKYDRDDPGAPLHTIVPRKPQPAAPEVYPTPVPVAAVLFSPKGEHVIAGGYHELTIWNVENGSLAGRIAGIGQRTHGLTFSPDGQLLAVASGTPARDGSVHLVDYEKGVIMREIAVSSETAFGVAFRPDGQKLATAGGDGSVRIFDVATREEEMVIK